MVKKKEICTDRHCPKHGSFSVRGREFIGDVKRISGKNSVVIEMDRLFFISKYERYSKRRTKLHIHIPNCENVKMGDKIMVKECRPISKIKSFVMIKRVEE
ncbi:MAG TPA: 30S ribosomal protein S17 [Candidatus Nanoarchaeia archaeon]|nr:30S ribosomal protein S17 [Candidatus Nanoarchaeia archaeon]